MRLARRFRGVALLAVAFLLFGAPSAPGVSVDWVPSIGVAWATPCDVTGGPEDSTGFGADTNDPCGEREPWWERIWDHLMNVLGWVWTAVNTVLGLIYGALGAVAASITDVTFSVSYGNNAVQFEGGSLPFTRGARAITIGNTVHYAEGETPEECELRVHEGHHVRQYQRLGPLFIPIYITVAVFTRYWDHPMEEAARREAESQCPTSP